MRSKIIQSTKMNQTLVTLLQNGVSRGLNEEGIRTVGRILKEEYGNKRLSNVEVVCFDSGREQPMKYKRGSLFNLFRMRGTIVGIRA